MSGVVGIFHRDGANLQGDQLSTLTNFLAYRAPDGLHMWRSDHIGFGHTLLSTSEASSDERQPTQLESMWITADVHLDSKGDLIKKLKNAGRRIEARASDPTLVLHAYSAWGPACVEHLRGDFAFGIWDSKAKTLFCARDHFGIKPFYYAEMGSVFLFSNTLNCLRQHPAVTNQLNESAIGDFLLFGLNYNKSTTTFQDIQRLPPAHALLVSRDKLQITCYWRPPTEERIRYARNEDYVDRFNELFKAAVADRLPPNRTGIFLSGGLDSGAVAAVATEFSRSQGGLPDVRSYTVGYDSLIQDDERSYACQLASYLRIPNKYLALDDIELFEKWDDGAGCLPEPFDDPLSGGLIEQFQMIASDCRVALSGEGPDNLMYFQMWPYMKELGRHREWSRLFMETARFLWIRPFPWLGAARRVESLVGKVSAGTDFPCWIAPKFAKRAGLEERWKEWSGLQIPTERHLARPKAHASMLLPQWANGFELTDPGVTRSPVEVRYPFLDLRIVNFLLGIPGFPWAYKKHLLRKSMDGRLPEAIQRRRKTPLREDPVIKKISRHKNKGMHAPHLGEQVSEFVTPPRLMPFYDTIEIEQLRPYCLDRWLQSRAIAIRSGGV